MTHQTHQPDALPQPAPDALINRALHSLRDIQAPTGLEARIAARLAQAADARTASSPPFANSRAFNLSRGRAFRTPFAGTSLYATAATILLAITEVLVHLHRKPQTVAYTNPPATILTGKASEPRAGGPPDTSVGRSPTYTPTTTTRGPEARSIVPIRSTATQTSTDPDTLARAETLAPSHPAPRMPLTAQEHLLLLATRQGQPMELAELETLRQPALQAAAEAHERATIRRYAQSLLGPLAAAEAISPTSPPDKTPTSQLPFSK